MKLHIIFALKYNKQQFWLLLDKINLAAKYNSSKILGDITMDVPLSQILEGTCPPVPWGSTPMNLVISRDFFRILSSPVQFSDSQFTPPDTTKLVRRDALRQAVKHGNILDVVPTPADCRRFNNPQRQTRRNLIVELCLVGRCELAINAT